jgi:hypothetical protein
VTADSLSSLLQLPTPELNSFLLSLSLSLSLILQLTVSWPVHLGIKHPSEAYDQILLVSDSAGLLICGDLFDERTGLSFRNAAGPSQRSHSWVRVPWDS